MVLAKMVHQSKTQHQTLIATVVAVGDSEFACRARAGTRRDTVTRTRRVLLGAITPLRPLTLRFDIDIRRRDLRIG